MQSTILIVDFTHVPRGNWYIKTKNNIKQKQQTFGTNIKNNVTSVDNTVQIVTVT